MLRILVTGLLLMTFVADAVGQPAPDLVDARAQELFQALNAGEDGDYREFIRTRVSERLQERYGEEELAGVLRDLAHALGPTEGQRPIREITVADEGGFYVGVRNAQGEPARLLLMLTDDTELRFDGFGLLPPELPPAPEVALSEIAPAIEEFVGARVEAGQFSGAVLVARDGEILFGRAYGLADRETGRLNTLDTPINLGSMNKMFTGLAIAQLEAAGKLNWQDTVGKHLPDFPNATVRDQARIDQLLTHSSGVPSYWNAAYEARKNEIDSLQGFLDTFVDDPLLFQPGQGNEYSNGGPVILGLIIERITGQSYFDYVREHIYAPAGMRNSGHFQKTETRSGKAEGYHRSSPGAELAPNTGWLGLQGSSAGGGYASANDLMRFAEALSAEKLLAREDLEVLWQVRRHMGPDFGYGYLWGTGTLEGQRWVGHNGGAPGISADFRYYSESGLVVIVLANQSRAAMPVSHWVNGLVTQGI
ncbi:MAG: serine hydrolase domain-containing protein [Xanthomonadales bacterium]|nr:serine hydrolase domain-containing protein [Xanthomonadales bacterium]